jgi:hypothetical protein
MLLKHTQRCHSSEQTSNNRIRSAHPNRIAAPIDAVPTAGSKSGLSNGVEIIAPGLDPGNHPPEALSRNPSTSQASSTSGEELPGVPANNLPSSKTSPAPIIAAKRPTGPRARDSIAMSTVPAPGTDSADSSKDA